MVKVDVLPRFGCLSENSSSKIGGAVDGRSGPADTG